MTREIMDTRARAKEDLDGEGGGRKGKGGGRRGKAGEGVYTIGV